MLTNYIPNCACTRVCTQKMEKTNSGENLQGVTWDLIHAETIETMRQLPAETFSAVVTDPPYCSGGFTEQARKAAKKQGVTGENAAAWFQNDDMSTGGLVWMLREVAAQSQRVLVDGGSLLLFTDWRMVPILAPALESAGLHYRNLITWNKGRPGMGNGFRPCHEMILHLVKGRPNFYSHHGRNVYDVPREPSRGRHHPTQKPVALMRSLLEVVAPVGGHVLDPFMGAGSTGLAAEMLGMHFTGIDREARFVQAAAERIEAQAQQLTIPMEEHAQAKK